MRTILHFHVNGYLKQFGRDEDVGPSYGYDIDGNLSYFNNLSACGNPNGEYIYRTKRRGLVTLWTIIDGDTCRDIPAHHIVERDCKKYRLLFMIQHPGFVFYDPEVHKRLKL